MGRFDGNWDIWRRRFVTGDDTVTLVWLSEQPGAPSYSSIRKRSAPKWEDWEAQRRNYRKNLGTIASLSPDAKEAAEQVTKLVDTAEMFSRHIKAARLAGSKALQALQMTDPATLKPREALDWLKFAVEAERLTEGLATQRQQIDFSTMSDAELEKLAKGES